jgi:hypothetical protein
MARNPFEQLQDVVIEPRQAFEDVVALILKCLCPDSRRVRVYRGDGGIDSFTGTLGVGGQADLFQIKYFPSLWEDSQKQQIRDAYGVARRCNDYQLKTWTLCVPTRLRREDLRWFDEWRGKQDRNIRLLDGDDLTLHLDDNRCAAVRNKLRDWGLAGIAPVSLEFAVQAFIKRQDAARTGLTAMITLHLKNIGHRSARDIVATVSHLETGCIAGPAQSGWDQVGARLEPRTLRYSNPLNPSEGIPIMGISLCDRSIMPFSISVRLTAQDMLPSLLECYVTSEQIAAGEPVQLLASDMRVVNHGPRPR